MAVYINVRIQYYSLCECICNFNDSIKVGGVEVHIFLKVNPQSSTTEEVNIVANNQDSIHSGYKSPSDL